MLCSIDIPEKPALSEGKQRRTGSEREGRCLVVGAGVLGGVVGEENAVRMYYMREGKERGGKKANKFTEPGWWYSFTK